MKITESQLRRIIREEKALLESESRRSELRQFAGSKSGNRLATEGRKIASSGAKIYELAEDQTGKMSEALYHLGEFVEKVGSTLAGVGSLEEGSSVTGGLPSVQELRQLHKELMRLEK